jgi:hypothetical protein
MSNLATRPSGRILLKLLIVVGALAMISSFCMPWWRYGVSFPEVTYAGMNAESQKRYNKDRDHFGKVVVVDHQDFYRKFKVEKRIDKELGKFDTSLAAVFKQSSWGDTALKKHPRIMIWGWHGVLAALFGLIFGGVILTWQVVAMCVPPLYRWNWIGSFVTFALAVPVVVTSLLWLLLSPGENVWLIRQGVMFGVFVALGGAGVAMLISLLDAILGLVGLIKGVGRKPAAAPAAAPSPTTPPTTPSVDR